MVWFGWSFPFRLFPRVWLCKDVRIAFVWNVGHGAIAFVTVLLHFRVTKRLLYSNCQRSKGCLTDEMFSQLLPLLCSQLPFGNRDFCFKNHTHTFPSTCSEQGIEFISLDEHYFVVCSRQNMIWFMFWNHVSVSAVELCWLCGLSCRPCSINSTVLSSTVTYLST